MTKPISEIRKHQFSSLGMKQGPETAGEGEREVGVEEMMVLLALMTECSDRSWSVNSSNKMCKTKAQNCPQEHSLQNREQRLTQDPKSH